MEALAERQLIRGLRDGDERAFMALVDMYGDSMLRLAMLYVRDRAVAEEVVQDAWLGVLRGIDRFEGRSSLKTWLYRILTNTAKTRGVRESRSIPFSSLGGADDEEGPAVDPDRFQGPDGEGHWSSLPRGWSALPEGTLLGRETLEVVQGAIESLPPGQKAVITLRDVEGWSAEEACNALDLSETNQRVLLHRARAKVRQALEQFLGDA